MGEKEIYIDTIEVPSAEILIKELELIEKLEKEHNVTCTLSSVVITNPECK